MFSRTAVVALPVALALLVASCGASKQADSSGSTANVASPLGTLNVLTRAYDNQRSGTNLAETLLNTQNVNADQFGKLFQLNVDDELYASLLYASAVSIGGAPHNVVYAATVSNSAYAFDADDGSLLWSRSYNGSGRPTRIQDTDAFVGCYNVTERTGITGTPVIDGVTQTMYFVTHTQLDGAQEHTLHAVDITSGAEKFGGPVAIDPSGFDSRYANQRPALALSQGVVYVAFASHCDRGPYHGWVIGFDATTLSRTAVVNVTPGGDSGGIWMGGNGPAFDESGNLYIATGNGSFNGNQQLGMSLVKFSPRTLTTYGYFTPSNYAALNDADLDLGSAGPSLIPDQNLLVIGGKGGAIYLLDRGALGGRVDGDTQIPQRFAAVSTAPHPSGTHHIHNGVVVWKSPAGTNMYVWGENDFLRAYRFNASGKFDTAAFAVGSVLPPAGMPGGMMALSANGSQAGTGILWATTQAVGDANNATVPGTLRAFDASSLRLLWESRSPGDDMLSLPKYNPPLIANGKVYMASFSNIISVYGLRTGPTPPIPNATYQIRLGTADGLCVDVDGGSSADAALVQQYPCNGSAAQRWRVSNVANNVYELVSEASGKCLDVSGGSNQSGAAIQQYTCNGTAAQRWVVESLGGGSYRLVSQTAAGSCLDVPGGSAQAAIKLQQYACNGSAAQTLTFALDNFGNTPIPEGTFRIQTSTRAGACLDAKGVLGDQGDLGQMGCNGSARQRFRFRRIEGDAYEIRAAISERCWDVEGASAADDATVQQYLCNSGFAQRWKVQALGSGKFQLLAQTGSDRCLDVEGGTGADEARLHQWSCNGTLAQLFSA